MQPTPSNPISSGKVGVIAAAELRYLLRENVLRLALGIFVVMALASSYISWSSQHILEVIYAQALTMLPSGSPVPPFPLDVSSPLLILKNMIIYVVLIGSLLAIILGNLIGTRDRKAKTLRVLFSRPISRGQYFVAKVAALAQGLALITGFALLSSLGSLLLLTRTLSFAQLGGALAFYALAYLFMFGFGLLALGFGLHGRRGAQALLIPIVLWIVIIFALPELGSALYPTGSLNPILPPTDVLQSSTLDLIHTLVYPFSVSEHYKALSSSLIGTPAPVAEAGTISYAPWLRTLLLGVWSLAMFGLAYSFAARLEVSRDDYE